MAQADPPITTVSTKGHVILPKAIRRRRDWDAGTRLMVEDTPEGVLLKAAPAFAPSRSDAVFGMLREAGFGDDAGLVFALIMNSVLTTVAMADDRATRPHDGAGRHVALRRNLADLGEDSAFGTGLGSYVDRWTGSEEEADETFTAYYRAMVTAILDGVAARLE